MIYKHKTTGFMLLISLSICLAQLNIDTNTTTTLSSTITTTTAKLTLETSTAPTTTAIGEDSEEITSIASETIGVQGTAATNIKTPDNEDDSLPGIAGKSISHAADDTGNAVVANENEKLTSIEGATDDALSSKTPSGATNENEEDESDEAPAASRDSKYKPSSLPNRLNMTQIDEQYIMGRRDESETVESWHKMSKNLKKGISGIIGSIVPFALNMSQEAKISSNCSGAMLKWVLSMNQLKAWALRMLDASGKPIAGLLEGSMTMFGNYRQCLKVRAPDDDEIEFTGEFREYFRGKYCIIQAKPWLPEKDRFYNLNTKLKSLVSEEENASYDRTIFDELSEWLLAFNFVNIRFDLCVPSLCSREDIQKAVNYLLRGIDMKARVARCEMDLPDGKFSVAAQVETGSAEVAEALAATVAASTGSDAAQNLSLTGDLKSFSQLGWILIPLVALVLVVISTLLSLTFGDDDDQDANRDDAKPPNKLKHTMKSLSLKRSIGSHLNIDYDQLADDKPLSLYGIRFLLVLWVILVESAVNLKFEYLRELMMLKDLIFWWPMQFIINSTMQYDSIILLTAFTMGYKNCLNDGANQAKALTRFIVDKFVRLMPSIMVMVALVILLPLVYRGPVWNDYVAKQSAVCQSTGWLNTIFLQNYLPFSEICLPQTWLLCVELQLVLIMAPLVYYLNKSYISNYGTSSMNDKLGNKQLTLVSSNGKQLINGKAPINGSGGSSCRYDSSKMFYWLWTTPGTMLTGAIVLGLAGSFYNVYYNQLPPSWFYTMADPDSKALYFGEHVTKLWTHLAVFAMGLLAGFECRRATRNVYRRGYLCHHHHNERQLNNTKSQSSSASSLPIIMDDQNGANSENGSSFKMGSQNESSVSINLSHNTSTSNGSSDICCLHSSNSDMSHHSGVQKKSCCSLMLDIFCFLLVITCMSAIIFSTHDWSLNELPKPLIAGLFDAGSRFLWSLAMIWILYKLSVPNEDRSFPLCARLLGHPVMVCLGKLSFLIYIIHPFVHTTVLAIQEQPIYSSWLMMFHILIGNITITVILALLVSLFVEMPCRNLFRRCGTSLLLTQSIQSGGGNIGTIGGRSVNIQQQS